MVLVEANGKGRRSTVSFFGMHGVPVDVREELPDPSDPAFAAGDGILAVSIPNPPGPLLSRLEGLKRSCPGLSVVGLVPAEFSDAVLPALDGGLLDIILPPGHPAGLYSAVRALELGKELARRNEAYRKSLARLKKEHAGDHRRARDLEEIYETTLENFMTALDMRDVETYGHSKTVARYSHVLAEALGLGEPGILNNIRKGALLHDAGKIAIPDSILKKPGPLTPEEWAKIRRHPSVGYGLIKDIKLVPEVGNIILCHHERFDGTGYPQGLKQDAIPLEARIFAVADTLDAITSHRPYRNPTDFRAARHEIVRNSGSQFDPRVVDAFCALDLRVWEKIRFETTRILPVGEALSKTSAGSGPAGRDDAGRSG
jgi:putative nucleotidyltransferase with HDIG domain